MDFSVSPSQLRTAAEKVALWRDELATINPSYPDDPRLVEPQVEPHHDQQHLPPSSAQRLVETVRANQASRALSLNCALNKLTDIHEKLWQTATSYEQLEIENLALIETVVKSSFDYSTVLGQVETSFSANQASLDSDSFS